MCLVITPIVPFIPLLLGGGGGGGPTPPTPPTPPPPPAAGPVSVPPPQQGVQQNQLIDQNQQTVENPNEIQNFEDFMSRFDRSYSSPDEQAFRQNVFIQNLNMINVSLKHSSPLQQAVCSSKKSLFLGVGNFHQNSQYFLFRITTMSSLLVDRLTP